MITLKTVVKIFPNTIMNNSKLLLVSLSFPKSRKEHIKHKKRMCSPRLNKHSAFECSQ
jgi:hypothetical protein